MFRAGSQLLNRSPEELFHIDYKNYQVRDAHIAVSQIPGIDQNELDELKPAMLAYLQERLPASGLTMLFVMLTNIITESTELLFVGRRAGDLVGAAFGQSCSGHSVVLPGVVSRKKQIVPQLVSTLEEGNF